MGHADNCYRGREPWESAAAISSQGNAALRETWWPTTGTSSCWFRDGLLMGCLIKDGAEEENHGRALQRFWKQRRMLELRAASSGLSARTGGDRVCVHQDAQ